MELRTRSSPGTAKSLWISRQFTLSTAKEGTRLVEALCYKPEGLMFRVPMKTTIFFFNLPNSSSSTMFLRFTKPLTEISTRRFFKGQSAVGAWGWQVSVGRLSRRCGFFDIWQPYGPPRPVTRITFVCCQEVPVVITRGRPLMQSHRFPSVFRPLSNLGLHSGNCDFTWYWIKPTKLNYFQAEQPLLGSKFSLS
jgi:hypothetical protein